MTKLSRIVFVYLFMAVSVTSVAEAAWVRPNKKPVSSWEGFQNSANGAVSHLLPWNWVGNKKNNKR